MRIVPRTSQGILALAGLLFVLVTVLRFLLESVADGYSLLYVLPIALSALAYGLPAGLAAATLAMALIITWSQLEDADLSLAGYLTRAVTFYVLGAFVGSETQRRRRFQDEREQLLARVEAMARTDELTGLENRRAWNDTLRRGIERCHRGADHPLSLAILDLDRFKAYNDRFGHPAGDLLLKDAAAVWSKQIRAVDTLARYGGEEFAVLLPRCSPAQATAVIERLRRATPHGQTVSAGIAHWDGTEPPEALLERADKALYEAKEAGRDQYVIAAG